MLKGAVFLLGLILTIGPCRAQLGESLDQCMARYGGALPSTETAVPGGIGEKFAVFRRDGLSIGIVFMDGAAALESFSKADGSNLSDKDKKTLLDADAPGHFWTKTKTSARSEWWTRDDGAVAIYSTAKHTLTLKSKRYAADQEARIISDEKMK